MRRCRVLAGRRRVVEMGRRSENRVFFGRVLGSHPREHRGAFLVSWSMLLRIFSYSFGDLIPAWQFSWRSGLDRLLLPSSSDSGLSSPSICAARAARL